MAEEALKRNIAPEGWEREVILDEMAIHVTIITFFVFKWNSKTPFYLFSL